VKLVKMRLIGESAKVAFMHAAAANAVDLLDNSPRRLDTGVLAIALLTSLLGRSDTVPRSVLEAIKMGIWDFEPMEIECSKFDASNAMPGTREKLCMLAERARKGLPLWHVHDRDDVESPPPVMLRRRPR
jgi:hypothetical protein